MNRYVGEETLFHLYVVTSIKTGKQYVGMTSMPSVQHRWEIHCVDARREHRTHSALHTAIRKHGASNFRVDHLESTNDFAECLHRETELIQQFASLYPNGYNLTHGGEDRMHTEEYRRRLSVGSRRFWADRKRSDHVRLQKSIDAKLQRASPQWRAWRKATARRGEANHLYGGKYHTAEWRAKVSAALKAKGIKPPRMSAERQSEVSRLNWSDPEYRQKMSDARRATWAKPSHRAKVAASMAAYHAARRRAPDRHGNVQRDLFDEDDESLS